MEMKEEIKHRLPPAFNLLLEFAEMRGLFKNEKSKDGIPKALKQNERPREPVCARASIPARKSGLVDGSSSQGR